MEWRWEAPARPCPGPVPRTLNAWVACWGEGPSLLLPSTSSRHRPGQERRGKQPGQGHTQRSSSWLGESSGLQTLG